METLIKNWARRWLPAHWRHYLRSQRAFRALASALGRRPAAAPLEPVTMSLPALEPAPAVTLASKDDPHARALIERYANQPQFPALSYATVRDYCDSATYFPVLGTRQNDLKDAQRPWSVKAVLNSLPPGSRLLEIGSGEPLAADALASLGYDVTICDPFDGSGNGPVEFEAYRAHYKRVKFIRSLFTPTLARTFAGQFDGIYSVSVLEHVVEEHLSNAFEAVTIALKPGGYSIHVIDLVLQGDRDDWHAWQMLQILKFQNDIARAGVAEAALKRELDALLERARVDLETFYLSPQGHNLWRGATPYDKFPFRKCIAVQSIVRAASGL
jgi:hypothetical protein